MKYRNPIMTGLQYTRFRLQGRTGMRSSRLRAVEIEEANMTPRLADGKGAPGTQLRQRALRRIESLLRRRSAPRAHMSLMVIGAGAAGFLASFALLHLGLGSIPLRYALSVAFAYGVFLLFIRWWIVRHRARQAATTVKDRPRSDSSRRNPDIPCDGVCDLVSALDDGLVVVVLLLASTISLAACVYVICTAPSLLAELFLDGVLAAGLYRRLRRLDRRHWLEAAIGRTWIPAAAILVSVFLAGLFLHHCAPEAKSLGEAWHQIVAQRPR